MAEKQWDGGEEPLKEREREALQELASAIVREPGRVPDPEKEAAEQRRQEIIEGGSTGKRRSISSHT